MISLAYAEVTWILNAYCQHQCAYCRPEYKTGQLDRSVEEYLSVVEKLQSTRYQHHSQIHWKIGGGEPLHFPYLGTLLKKIRERPAIVTLETSGDDTWFSFMRIAGLIDRLDLTYHSWQNDDVFDLVLEQAQEKNISVSITVPLLPGLVNESREKVQQFASRGYASKEQILYDDDGKLYRHYSQIDENRIFGRPDDYVAEPIEPAPTDLSVVNNTDPVYTGWPCYAGVDWLYIGPKGFASYSQCGGRSEHYNAFDPNWQPPNSHFACTMNQCRSEQDRRTIRIVGT